MTQQPHIMPHIILETANFHGGDADLLERTINAFAATDYPNRGIKFHAFKPDNVALPDFSWYPVVKNFFISPDRWAELIQLSNEKGFDVWLDLFCVYGVETLARNCRHIRGIKFQPSVLDNLEIMAELKTLDLSSKELIINVSGLELGAVEQATATFGELNFKKIILQLGFQDYPTKIEDTSLRKIDILRAAFPDAGFSYADHIDGGTDFAHRFPVYAWLKGCQYLEKHICLKREETEYDAASALEPGEMAMITDEIKRVSGCFGNDFISRREAAYFTKTLQKPVLNVPLHQGQLVASQDVIFRRTDQPGLNYRELTDVQGRFCLLNREIKKGKTMTTDDFKPARIAAVVAARMKSSRLKQKAILPIHGMSSIERCLDNCLKFPGTNMVVLATSTENEDAVLGNYTLDGKVEFWQGDPEDVISRYLGACRLHGIDVIVRVTGDCPVVSPEIADFLLNAHFAAGADFTECRDFAVGSNSQIYNVEALERVIQLTGRAEYSEHMTLYMTNNPDIFKVNIVDLPPELVRDYRLTLDYQEDLDMFNALFDKLAEKNLDSTLLNVFNILDNHPEIPKINAHKTLVYKTDQDLIRLLNEKTRIKI